MPAVARIAALAAGIAMGKTGIAVVREDELLDLLSPGRLSARKLAGRNGAVEKVERWRRRGLRVGFLAGEAGHLAGAEGQALLTEARAWCDRLVVGVPGVAEGAAAVALAELALVDLVTGCGRDGAADAIRALRPDVLVQPSGGPADTIPGGDLLQEWGGELRIAGLEQV